MPTTPTLTISMIIHEDYTHVEAALHSLYAHTATPFQVMLTINSGPDPRLDRLRARYPDMHIRHNAQPRGFAANHNAALAQAQTPFTALLNDDIVLHPGALDTLVGYLRAQPDVGLVGPAILNPDGTPQLSVFSDPSLLRMIYRISGLNSLTRHGGVVRRALQASGLARCFRAESLQSPAVTRPVPVVVGVAMVVRREAYLQAGLMDEATLVYGEEFGWQWRLRQSGWRVVYVAEAAVTHYNTTQVVRGWKLAEHRKGILNYFVRYRPRWQAALIRGTIIGIHALYAALQLPFSRAAARDNWRTARMGLTWKP